MTAQIQKGIKLPSQRAPKKFYPWREMKVGDSFLFDTDQLYHNQMANAAGNRLNMKFSIRKTPDGVRCWRVK